MNQKWFGVALFSAGLFYLILFQTWLPAWAWGWFGGLALLAAYRERGTEEAFLPGALFIGWSLGVILDNLFSLQAFRLAGLGAGFWLYGWVTGVGFAYSAAYLLVSVFVLVILWSLGAAPWLALFLVLAAGYWLLRPKVLEQLNSNCPDQTVFLALLEWRISQARLEGRVVSVVLPDALLARLAREHPSKAAIVRKQLGEAYAVYVDPLTERLREATDTRSGSG